MRALLVFFFLLLSFNVKAEDHVRIVFEEVTIYYSKVSSFREDQHFPRRVVDFNNLLLGVTTEINIGDEFFSLRVGGWGEMVIGRRSKYEIFRSDTNNAANDHNILNVNTTNGQTFIYALNIFSDGPQVLTYTYRGDSFPESSIGEGPFDEDDKDLVSIRHIDLDQNTLIGFKELYVKDAEIGFNVSRSIYFSDSNGDGNADTGELFADSSGLEELSQSVEDIPIRASLDDTDGDGVDEGEDEDEVEKTIDDYMPGLAEFKQHLGIEGLSITAEKDIDFQFDVGGRSYGYQGVQSDPILNSARLGIKALLSLYFTFMFLRSVITTVRQW
jgi:hypothetical protein